MDRDRLTVWNNCIYSANVTRRCNNGLSLERSAISRARKTKEYCQERVCDGQKRIWHVVNDYTRRRIYLAFRMGKYSDVENGFMNGFRFSRISWY